MNTKKSYIKPSVTLIHLDKSITLMMVSNPGPWGNGGTKSIKKKDVDDPFQSPFADKPFS
jgi:hypothetical protein